MSTHLAAGLACAVGAAVLYGAGPVAQAIAARRTDPALGRLLLRLARQPIWLAGLVCEIGGFLLEAVAFAMAPAALVAPVMACDMLVFVVAAWLAFGGRPSRAGVGGAVTLGAGVALLAVAFSAHAELGHAADTASQFAFLAAAFAIAGVTAVGGSAAAHGGRSILAAGWFGAAAGGCYGLATVATRQVGRTFTTDHPLHLLRTPTPYLLIGCSILAMLMLQRGLQTGPILAFPLTSALSALLPVVIGTTLLGDQAPDGARRGVFVFALVLMIAGVGLLSRDRSLAEDPADAQRRVAS